MSRPMHFEIQASNPQALIDFYSGLFGWSFNKWEGGDYWMIQTGSDNEPGINGGLLPRRGPPPENMAAVNAFCITVDAGAKSEIKPAALSEGTRVEVKDLFYATPARLKFLRSDRAEMQAVTEVMQLGIPVSRIEFLDELQIAATNRYSRRSDPLQPTLFLEFGGMPAAVGLPGLRSSTRPAW